jgi:hypothetical protein
MPTITCTSDASCDYNASSGLERIQAVLLAINSADDERNPPTLGLLEREITRVKNGRVLLIPGSDQTTGHGTSAHRVIRHGKSSARRTIQMLHNGSVINAAPSPAARAANSGCRTEG